MYSDVVPLGFSVGSLSYSFTSVSNVSPAASASSNVAYPNCSKYNLNSAACFDFTSAIANAKFAYAVGYDSPFSITT